MNESPLLQAVGLAWPTPAYLLGTVLFSLVGYGAWRVGKQRGRPRTRWIGFALMAYPIAVSSTLLLYAIGGALCIGLVLDRERR